MHTLSLPMLPWIALGALLAAGAIYSNGRMFRGQPRKILRLNGMALVGAALIYVAFVLVDGSYAYLPLELAGLAIYSAMALGGQRWPAMLGWGWIAHSLWDVAFDGGRHYGYTPEIYPALCLGFDLWLGTALLLAFRKYKADPARAEGSKSDP